MQSDTSKLYTLIFKSQLRQLKQLVISTLVWYKFAGNNFETTDLAIFKKTDLFC